MRIIVALALFAIAIVGGTALFVGGDDDHNTRTGVEVQLFAELQAVDAKLRDDPDDPKLTQEKLRILAQYRALVRERSQAGKQILRVTGTHGVVVK